MWKIKYTFAYNARANKKTANPKMLKKIRITGFLTDLVFLILAYKGIYIKREVKSRAESKGWKDIMKEAIELLRLCLVMKELAEQLLL
jgi:hypothetical protein